MKDLIARLEAATGPDRELDAAIEIAVSGGSAHDLAYVTQRMANEQTVAEAVERTLRPPRYTASIDAALSLVPEGFDWSVDGFGSGRGRAYVWPEGTAEEIEHAAATPALALCIAALRAREAGDA